MDIAKLDTAMNAAMLFVIKADDAKKKWEEDWARESAKFQLTDRKLFRNVSAENASCKRASMDLTRALANLRKH